MNRIIHKRLLLVGMLCLMSTSLLASECVVLLHGLARSDHSMRKLERALIEEGYAVVNYGYPSTSYNIATLAKDYLPKAIAQCTAHTTINFVTHSLGGIVLRQYLSENELDQLGRVVMLGPPNKGSQVVDNLKNVPGFKIINGPAGIELGTDPASVPNSLGEVTYPVGVVAGSSSINLMLSQMLPNPDDGKVSVENTKVEGMTDHIVVPVSHPFLMRSKEVIRQVTVFLKTGNFSRDK